MMEVIRNPKQDIWNKLVARPGIEQSSLTASVNEILKDVSRNKDQALIRYTKIFDGIVLSELKVSEVEVSKANEQISDELKGAINLAKNNIEAFHSTQLKAEESVETSAGVNCWRENRAIEKVGLYIPGGSAPLFSTILMLGIPAKLAGSEEIILCTPPGKDGCINPAILYTANLVGVTTIFKVGGAQAIGAMAYGTESVPRVDKIFGPGNQFVTKAKELIQQAGIAIDMPAGPSELLIIADVSANAAFIAADLLSQAEHGSDSQVILLTDSSEVITAVTNELEKQLEVLPRKDVAKQALANSKVILFDSMATCLSFSNMYSPEHLILAMDNANTFIGSVQNAGSVFIGKFSCESAGDYASGTNHTLPTNGYARNYSGVSIDSFVKKITFQELTAEGIKNIGPSIELMAEAEGLMGHKNAVTMRLKSLK